MDKAYLPTFWEPLIRDKWDKDQSFVTHPDSGKEPFCIIFPPPNANGSLHVGHAMYVYQDIMCRRARQQGKEVFWVFGTDHAGIETQFVFEKYLAKQDKSRFDYDRDTLFQMIKDFVAQSQGVMKSQLRTLGFSLDWSRECYTLDPGIIQIVNTTFQKLFNDGLVYRADRLVAYCCKDGTSFSDLEVDSEEVEGILYHICYGPITVATTRPETMLGDVAVMVHPDDKRYQKLINTTVKLPIVNREIPVIADSSVDMDFGTGAVKVTPAHDQNDFEVGQRHHLPFIQVIGFDGKIYGTGTAYDGMRVKAAREAIVQQLKQDGLLVKEEAHQMVLKKCYKCKSILEPLPKKQWYIKIKPLIERAINALESDQTIVHPDRFTDVLRRYLSEFIDWNISRQIVWGIRIPAFQNVKTGEWKIEIDSQKQTELVNSGLWKQDEDTFDTWFSSGQWPFATLQHLQLFDKFYPTTIMETGYDIARAWVARMMMLGIYVTGKTPFSHIYFHGLVRDGKGQKMSKSKGNVVDPLKLTGLYGTDALRAALVFESTSGADLNVSEDKVRGMRNFINKIWNIGRFIQMLSCNDPSTHGSSASNLKPQRDPSIPSPCCGEGGRDDDTSVGVSTQKVNVTKSPDDNKPTNNDPTIDVTSIVKDLSKEFDAVKLSYETNMDNFEFSVAFVLLHEFVWHRFADYYVEKLKNDAKSGNIEVSQILSEVYLTSIRMLEPFIPFVCNAISQVFDKKTNT